MQHCVKYRQLSFYLNYSLSTVYVHLALMHKFDRSSEPIFFGLYWIFCKPMVISRMRTYSSACRPSFPSLVDFPLINGYDSMAVGENRVCSAGASFSAAASDP